jgi:hypothetical protein
MSLLTNLEDTLSAMKALFMSPPRMGKLGPWDEESDVDELVVSEDLP